MCAGSAAIADNNKHECDSKFVFALAGFGGLVFTILAL